MARYSYSSGGQAVHWYSPIVYSKANMQPWRQGYAIENDIGGFYFAGYEVLFMKENITYDLTDLPMEIDPDQEFREYAYVDGQWYLVEDTQSWTRGSRRGKHYKKFILTNWTIQSDIPKEYRVAPTPLASLTDNFGEAVRELQQTTIIVDKETGE